MKDVEYYTRKLSEVNFLQLLCDDASDMIFYRIKASYYQRKLDELAAQSGCVIEPLAA